MSILQRFEGSPEFEWANALGPLLSDKLSLKSQEKKVMSLDNLRAKFEAFNWHVMEMEGNDVDAVVAGLTEARTFVGKGKPIIILMKTARGFGVDFMVGNYEWHGVAPNDAQLELALKQLPSTMPDY